MDYLMNDLSLAGQFPDLHSFHEAVDRIMLIRQEIQRGGASFWCHRSLVYAQVTATSGMQQAVQTMPPSKRSAWMQWITRLGPYWEDVRRHQSADWLEARRRLGDGFCAGGSRGLSSHTAYREKWSASTRPLGSARRFRCGGFAGRMTSCKSP